MKEQHQLLWEFFSDITHELRKDDIIVEGVIKGGEMTKEEDERHLHAQLNLLFRKDGKCMRYYVTAFDLENMVDAANRVFFASIVKKVRRGLL